MPSQHTFSLIAILVFTSVLVGCQTPNPELRQRAEGAIATDNLEAAEQALLQAVAQDPRDWRARWLLGQVYLGQNRPLDAQLVLERAHALRGSEPQRDDIEDDIAEALYLQNDPDALSDFLAEASRGGGQVADYLREGKYLAKISDFDGASVAIKKAIAIDRPPTAKPYLALADLYETVGDVDRTIKSLRHAYYFDPKNPLISSRLEHYNVIPGPTAALPPE